MNHKKKPAHEMTVQGQADKGLCNGWRRLISANFKADGSLLGFDGFDSAEQERLQAIVREKMLRKFGLALRGDGTWVYSGAGAGCDDLPGGANCNVHDPYFVRIHMRLRMEQLLRKGMGHYSGSE